MLEKNFTGKPGEPEVEDGAFMKEGQTRRESDEKVSIESNSHERFEVEDDDANMKESEVDEKVSTASSSESFKRNYFGSPILARTRTKKTKKKCSTFCNFSWKCVTIILIIFLAAAVATLLTLLLLPKSIPNSENFFRLIKDYHVSDIPSFACHDDFKKLKQDLLSKLKPTDNFWSDKIQTQKCLNGVEKGVNMVPILWSAQISSKITEQNNLYEFLDWDAQGDAAQNNLHEFLNNDENWKMYPEGFLLKPSHLGNSNNIIKIEKDFIWDNIKDQVNQIPMTTEKIQTWQKDPKNFEFTSTLTPGLILQKQFDLSGNPFRKINFSVVWGKVVSFSWSDSSLDGTTTVGIKINEEENFRFCLVSDVDKGCADLEKMMNWDLIIPRLEKFAFKLHLDFVRIDIFPYDHANFYINGISLDSDQIGKMNYPTLKKLKSLNAILKNSEHSESFFLDPRLHHLRCNIFDYPPQEQ